MHAVLAVVGSHAFKTQHPSTIQRHVKRRILATLEKKLTLWKQLEENYEVPLEHHYGCRQSDGA